MSKSFYLLVLLFVSIATGCSDDSTNTAEPVDDRKFVPTDVSLKTKSYYPIADVFNFINSFSHDVEVVQAGVYISALPNDSLQYVRDYVNAKPYTDSTNWPLGGYVSAVTNELTFFPRLYHIKDNDNQKDWLETMSILKLSEDTDNPVHGCLIRFHVPAGTEKFWVNEFKKYEFVEWAELNYYMEIEFD